MKTKKLFSILFQNLYWSVFHLMHLFSSILLLHVSMTVFHPIQFIYKNLSISFTLPNFTRLDKLTPHFLLKIFREILFKTCLQ